MLRNIVLILALLAGTLAAQTAPNAVADAQQTLTDVTNLTAQLASAQAQIVTAQAQLVAAQAKIATLTPQAAFSAQLDLQCPDCRAVISFVLASAPTFTANWLCCGPTTVPPTPIDLGGSAMVIFIPTTASSVGGVQPASAIVPQVNH